MCEEGVQPDDITFVCLLSACTHTHLVDEGRHCFYFMSTVYMIPAKLVHYTCMVDLLGHAGHLQDVEIMIKEMPCNQMLFCGGFCSVLAEFMIMWRWENTLLNEFLNCGLKMLQVSKGIGIVSPLHWHLQVIMLVRTTGVLNSSRRFIADLQQPFKGQK
jgi:hypothetical protein